MFVGISKGSMTAFKPTRNCVCVFSFFIRGIYKQH